MARPSYDSLDFRVLTAWPTGAVVIPSVVQVDASIRGNKIDYGHVLLPKMSLPPEVALRVVPGMDAGDSQALLDFTNTFGPLTPANQDRDVALLPWITQFSLERWAKKEPAVDSDPSGGAARIEVAGFHIRVLQALVGHWNAHQRADDEGVIGAWSWLVHGLLDGADRIDDSVGSSWDLWTSHMNAALAPVTAQISVRDSNGKRRGWDPNLGATSYSALVTEIFQDVANNTPWHKCANDKCGLLFARQQGRSQKGRNRTSGVMYCSQACGNAQGQRNLRKRRAAKREMGKRHGRKDAQ